MKKLTLMLFLTAIATVAVAPAHAESSSGQDSALHAVPPVANPCPRLAAGSIVQNPPSLFSQHGVLTANFSYQTTTDADGKTLFCFMTPDGLENPTLRVHPGDHLVINVTNNTPAMPVEMHIDPPNCGDTAMTESSVNIHYHGTNTSPTCHSDEVIHTVINSGHTFIYNVHFPADEPPGMYWYHPHIHGHVEAALQGGGSGAIIVEGIEDFQHAVAAMRQMILIVRDQNVAGDPPPGDNVPAWDLTLNNIPIAYPAEIPAVMRMHPGERQLWRVSNSSADSIIDLQVRYDGTAQKLQIVGLDGVPTGSQDGTRRGRIVNARHVLIPVAGRAEFIVTGPSSAVKNAKLVTLAINTGSDGDNDPQRTLATIQTVAGPLPSVVRNGNAVPATIGPTWKQRFENLAIAKVTAQRSLYFSENNPLSQFFITVEGATPTLFDPNNPPAIVTTQGSVEDWTIENRALEVHNFHIHQIHFMVLSQKNFEANGSKKDPSIQRQFMDTIQIPSWDGNPHHRFPRVTVRMDFRGMDIGDFVYHCHIAEHEDNGMMAIVRVVPATASARPALAPKAFIGADFAQRK